MTVDTTALIQLAITVCLSLFFTAVALERKTLVSTLLCSVVWLVSGIVNWLFAPASTVGQGISYLFWIIGVVFAGYFLYLMANYYFDLKSKRFETGPM